MRKLLKLFISALFVVVLMSCAGDSVLYKKLVYEASSNPPVNMAVRMRFPGKEALYGTAGSVVKQDCGYVPETFLAKIDAELEDMGEGDSQVTVRIYMDDKCVAEKTGTNSASVSYCEKTITQ